MVSCPKAYNWSILNTTHRKICSSILYRDKQISLQINLKYFYHKPIHMPISQQYDVSYVIQNFVFKGVKYS